MVTAESQRHLVSLGCTNQFGTVLCSGLQRVIQPLLFLESLGFYLLKSVKTCMIGWVTWHWFVHNPLPLPVLLFFAAQGLPGSCRSENLGSTRLWRTVGLRWLGDRGQPEARMLLLGSLELFAFRADSEVCSGSEMWNNYD